ncbi:hypothetical protein F4775DRAFT_556294 [Biscogniauxia sp. FL1348]|nr:hypothetical protein F4775DRAFT_556294 [Biscogniauxia sp. FL1348]
MRLRLVLRMNFFVASPVFFIVLLFLYSYLRQPCQPLSLSLPPLLLAIRYTPKTYRDLTLSLPSPSSTLFSYDAWLTALDVL